jgi:hypothetical protein
VRERNSSLRHRDQEFSRLTPLPLMLNLLPWNKSKYYEKLQKQLSILFIFIQYIHAKKTSPFTFHFPIVLYVVILWNIVMRQVQHFFFFYFKETIHFGHYFVFSIFILLHYFHMVWSIIIYFGLGAKMYLHCKTLF